MASFLMVTVLAAMTLYIGVYVAEAIDAMELRRCRYSDSTMHPERRE